MKGMAKSTLKKKQTTTKRRYISPIKLVIKPYTQHTHFFKSVAKNQETEQDGWSNLLPSMQRAVWQLSVIYSDNKNIRKQLSIFQKLYFISPSETHETAQLAVHPTILSILLKCTNSSGSCPRVIYRPWPCAFLFLSPHVHLFTIDFALPSCLTQPRIHYQVWVCPVVASNSVLFL